MRICLLEDSTAAFLEPLALTRPVFDLRCGAETLGERLRRVLAADEVGAWVRPHLAELCSETHPDMPVNDAGWLRERPTVLVNARWLPDTAARIDTSAPCVGIVGEQVAYLVLPDAISMPDADELDLWLARWKKQLPAATATGMMIDRVWDLVDANGEMLILDAAWFTAKHGVKPVPPGVMVQGPPERLVIADGAQVEAFVTIDTRQGPVLIEKGAHVHAFSRIEGPCFIGEQSWIVGAKIRAGCTFGPWCKLGGEVEASIVQGYSNKVHDGFLGHSYLGEWVNLAAGTQTSDLRNDYGKVSVTVNGQRANTGRTKVGSCVGDHVKTGLGALLNTGSMIGAFAGVLPSGFLAPQVVPSFCQVQHGQLHEQWDLRKLLTTAATVMRRRGRELTETQREFYHVLYEMTGTQRRKTLREIELRRLKRSVP